LLAIVEMKLGGWGRFMRRKAGFALAAMVVLAVAGCGKDKAPTGQVVATVDGDEITSVELRNEMRGFNPPTPEIRKAAERQALESIINRKLLAKAADKAGATKTPAYAQEKERMEETLVVQTWQNQLVNAVPQPSREEVDQFIAANPDMYAARKVFVVDQLRFPRITDPEMVKALQPMKSLGEVAAYLGSRRIPSQAAQGEIDALSLDPRVLKQIVALPAGEIFVVPANNLMVANAIRETKVVPVPTAQAMKHATAFIRNQRARESVQRQFASVVQAGKKEVVYSKAYQPAPPAKAAPKAAGAPAPAPAPKS
jgi:EpsD family peptidyl-prolyl cis-trans isomerase